MADRELRVLVLGDSTSLQTSMVRAEASTMSWGVQMEKAVVISGQAGGMADGLARKMGALNSLGFTPATVGLIGVTAGLGLAVEAGKTMIDNADKNEKAQRGLEQAFASQGIELSAYQRDIQNFLDVNKRFIADEYIAKDSIAAFTRAGYDQVTVMRLVNDALDLSGATGKSLEESTQALLKAEQGRFRGLIDLGVSIKGVTAGNVDQIASQQRIAEAIAEVEAKTKNGRQATSDLVQAQNSLNHSTEEFSNKYGPAMTTALSNVVDMLDLSIQSSGILVGKIGDVLNAAGAAPASFNANRGRFGGAQAPAPASFVPSSRGTFAGNADDMGPGAGANVNITQHFSVPDPAAAAALMRQEVHRIFS